MNRLALICAIVSAAAIVGVLAAPYRPSGFSLLWEAARLTRPGDELNQFCYDSYTYTLNYIQDIYKTPAGSALLLMLTASVDLERDSTQVIVLDSGLKRMISEFNALEKASTDLEHRITETTDEAGVERRTFVEADFFKRALEVKVHISAGSLEKNVEAACDLLKRDVFGQYPSIFSQTKSNLRTAGSKFDENVKFESLDCTIAQRVIRAHKFCDILSAAPAVYTLLESN